MRIGINLLSWEPGRRGGVETYNRNLLRALLDLGTDDTFVLFLSQEARGGVGLESPRLEECFCPVRSRRRFRRALWEQLRLGRWLAQSGVEVLFCPHSLLPALRTGGTPGLPPIPMVQLIHDLQVFDLPDNFPWWKRAYLHRRLPASAGRAARIIAISEFTCQRVLRLLKPPAAKVLTILEAAAPEFAPRPEAEIAALCERHSLRRPYLLCLATSHSHKRLDHLVRVFDRLVTERGWGEQLPIPPLLPGEGVGGEAPSPLLSAGGGMGGGLGSEASRPGVRQLVLGGLPGSGRAELEAAVAACRNPQAVRHLGRMPAEDLPGLYSGALGFVFPSVYEGFGLPLLEAMACGCPVLSSDCASLPEVAADAALLYDGLSDEALAAGLIRLVEEPELQAQLQARGFQRAQTLTWTKTARETLAVLVESRESSR